MPLRLRRAPLRHTGDAETDIWSNYLAALADRELSGILIDELRDALIEAATALEPDWDRSATTGRRAEDLHRAAARRVRGNTRQPGTVGTRLAGSVAVSSAEMTTFSVWICWTGWTLTDVRTQ
ncbi:hypothetical protein [Nocardia sp. NPDC057440]|uniref:hypothetical protein n=1 Tax=Nocardia sp. NPDC057440 TaxID=3346134 RepID=UPI00366C9B62